jgi:hypothetical protein
MHTPKVRAFVDFLVAQLDFKGLARHAHVSEAA